MKNKQMIDETEKKLREAALNDTDAALGDYADYWLNQESPEYKEAVKALFSVRYHERWRVRLGFLYLHGTYLDPVCGKKHPGWETFGNTARYLASCIFFFSAQYTEDLNPEDSQSRKVYADILYDLECAEVLGDNDYAPFMLSRLGFYAYRFGIEYSAAAILRYNINAAERGSSYAAVRLAVTYIRLDDKKNAGKWATEALKLANDEDNIPALFCSLCDDQGDENLIITLLDTLEDIPSHTPTQHWLDLAAFFCMNERFVVAFQCYYIAESLSPDANTECRLAILLDKHLPDPDRESLDWYLAAAEKEHPQAIACVGWHYLYGNGKLLPQDKKLALAWNLRAAALGDPGAHYNLGNIYRDGIGVMRNLHKAVEYYRYAAEHGVASAKEALQELMQ